MANNKVISQNYVILEESDHSEMEQPASPVQPNFATKRSVKALRRKVLKVEGKLSGLANTVAKEMGYNRRKNLLFFQFDLGEEERKDKGYAITAIGDFIDEYIMNRKGWTKDRIKNAFRLGARYGTPPLLAIFRNAESVFEIMGHCNRLASFNSSRKRKGLRPVSVRRHFDELTASRIQYLATLQRAIRGCQKYAGISVIVREQVQPFIVIDGVTYSISGIPEEYRNLIPKYEGL